jgi:23S rRNA (adenine2503-C2)-methyltransferase
MTPKQNIIIGLTLGELESFAEALGESAYRGRQIYDWVYRCKVRSFAEMTNLPASFRSQLEQRASLDLLTITRHTGPTADGTQKFLFQLADGMRIETVYLPESPGETNCVSSQVGCALGCEFCATAKMGFYRNLSAGEIIQQIFAVEHHTGATLTNVVFMGMGEPLHNYDEVVKSLRLLTDPAGMALTPKRITVSTVGIIPMVERWIADNPPAKLAISLHATTDERRASLMPVNRAYPLSDLMKSLRRLAHVTRYVVTFEYIMIAGFNDRREDATNLRSLLRNIPAKINLIRLHPTGSALVPSSDTAIGTFMGWLTEVGIDCTLRESRGVSDSAACGMLFVQEPFKPSKARAWERS